MNFRALYRASLDNGLVSATAAGTEVDLSKTFVEPGKREIAAMLSAFVSTSDSGTFDYKLQESNTTVDSDFADITGAAFAQVTDAAAAKETIYFNTTKRYIRGHRTVGAAVWGVSVDLLLTKRDA